MSDAELRSSISSEENILNTNAPQPNKEDLSVLPETTLVLERGKMYEPNLTVDSGETVSIGRKTPTASLEAIKRGQRRVNLESSTGDCKALSGQQMEITYVRRGPRSGEAKLVNRGANDIMQLDPDENWVRILGTVSIGELKKKGEDLTSDQEEQLRTARIYLGRKNIFRFPLRNNGEKPNQLGASGILTISPDEITLGSMGVKIREAEEYMYSTPRKGTALPPIPPSRI